MKYILAALIVSQAVAFTFVNQPRMPTVLSAEPYVVTEGEGVINVNVSVKPVDGWWLDVYVEKAASGVGPMHTSGDRIWHVLV
jgi:hypothetical protein